MMIFIMMFNIAISMIMLLLLKTKKIGNHTCIIKYVNTIQIGLHLLIFITCGVLLSVTSPKHPIINNGRALGIWTTFICTILGVVVLLFNIVMLLVNRFKNK